MERLTDAKITDDMPFKDEVIFGKKSEPAEYTCDKEQKCDWKIIFEEQSGYQFPVPDGEKLSPAETYQFLREKKVRSRLDGTQLMAIQKFFENRVALIQGPPGTGKSFLGSKIVQLMLSMKIQERFKGPILVMTYKNYALDHFLKMLLEHCPQKIVRIGSGGKSEGGERDLQIEEINLNNVRKKVGLNRDLYHENQQVLKELRSSQSKLKRAFKKLTESNFTLETFLKGAQKCHIRSLLTGSSESKIDKKEEEIEKLLSEWDEEKGLQGCPRDLKDLVGHCLQKWLPTAELNERYRLYEKRKKEKEQGSRKSPKPPSESNSEDYSDSDALDPKVIMNERLRDADEESSEFFDQAEMSDPEEDVYSSDDGICFPLSFLDFMDKKEEELVFSTLQSESNVWDLLPEERTDFVYALRNKVIKQNVKDFTEAAMKYENSRKKYQEIQDTHTVHVLKKYDVIGMTITGAAMRLRILAQIKPCAVIVEEAAEIVEGQLISVIPPTVKHLVMIGDQKQLKPPVSCYELRTKNLDCSMFERLINNELDYQQLGKQCRMRDDIANLLRALKIYNKLDTNKAKTKHNEPPECIGSSMYFCTHTDLEKDMPRTRSKYNQMEIIKILDVAKHLVKNEYPPEHITVLCAYRGQVERMQAAFQRESTDTREEFFTKLKDIRITTVDSFQGEENNVILLSLVRSNGKGKIGFLAVQNRICVALSRARCALYIFGNPAVYKNSQNWKKILDLLQKEKLVGTRLPLRDDKIPSKSAQLLTQRRIELFASKIGTKWSRLARLLNFEENVVDSIRDGNEDACYKAVKLLQRYKKDPKFNMEEFLYWMKYLDIHVADKDMEEGESSFQREARTEAEEQPLHDKTPLSPREIERLSREITDLWKKLARLLNMEENEISNVECSNTRYPDESEKAAKMLCMYKEKRDKFSRATLGKHLDEIGRSKLQSDVLKGTLREK